ncbi:hypothetical protein TNCV_2293611 [Trichonephila clavipes]|nr:hypothetical protein TNCV_2293611 [Trichonephila clavipes]
MIQNWVASSESLRTTGVNTQLVKTTFHIASVSSVVDSSHVDIEGNKIEDTLAKAGACQAPETSAPLTFMEIFSKIKHQNKTAWIAPREPLVSVFWS